MSPDDEKPVVMLGDKIALTEQLARFRDPYSAEAIGLTHLAKRIAAAQAATPKPRQGNRKQRRAAKRKRNT